MKLSNIPNVLKNTIGQDEKVDTVFKYDRRTFFRGYLGVVVCFLFGFLFDFLSGIFIFLGIIFLVVLEIKVRNTYFVITDKKVIRTFSFISKDYVDLRFVDIKNTYYKQTVVQRIFSQGEIHLSTAGTDGLEMVLGPFVEYMEFFRLVDSKRNL